MIRLTFFLVVIGLGLAMLILHSDNSRILGLQSDDFG
ncbi:TIGR02281 family clan AA aspartic protease, partial [Rhizobium leguminosarum]